MEKANLKVRKWGNSFGVVLPRMISNQPVHEGMEIEITIRAKNKTKVRDVFGILKKELKEVDTKKALRKVDEAFWPEE